MKYCMSNSEFWGDRSVTVDIKKTAKTTTITPISPKPQYFTPGCIDKLWYNGKIVIREYPPESHRICANYLQDWGDGSYTLYHCRQGIPFLLTPAKEDK